MKQKIFDVLNVSIERKTLSWYFDIFIITLIILNVIAIVLESVEQIRNNFQSLFNVFEIVSVVVFTVEYILRVWTANLHSAFKKPFWGNLKFVFTPLAVIDLLAFIPFYLPFIGVDLRLIRILRIFRIFRLFKIARYVEALTFINKVFRNKKEELIISLIFTVFLLLVSSTLMYYIENEAQPGNFSSIPETMWWGIATLTTVGYGDIYPMTPIGQFLGGVIAVVGIGLFALPTGILASGFSDEISRKKTTNENLCEKCRNQIEENASFPKI